MKIKKENLYIGLSFILGILLPFVWLLTIGLLNDLKNKKGVQISFFKINIIIFIIAFLFGIFPILLAFIQIFISNSNEYIPFHMFSYYTIPLAFGTYIMIFLGYNLYVWRKLNE